MTILFNLLMLPVVFVCILLLIFGVLFFVILFGALPIVFLIWLATTKEYSWRSFNNFTKGRGPEY